MADIHLIVGVLQGLVIILAAIAGGIWAVYKYFTQQQAAPEMDFQIEQIDDISNLFVLNVNLTVHNHGNRNLFIDIATANCAIKKAHFNNNDLFFKNVISYNPWATLEYIVRSNSVEHWPFLCQVPEPGIYFFDIRVGVSHRESRVSNRIKSLKSRHNDWQWRACKIFVVKSPNYLPQRYQEKIEREEEHGASNNL